MQAWNETAHQVLDVAEELTQQRGFSAFSYKSIASEVGIKTSSIHYYFPTKNDLALAMVERYSQRFDELCAAIVREERSPTARLRRYAQRFQAVLEQGNRLCLCGMLATDLHVISDPVREVLRQFFENQRQWLADTLQAGIDKGEFRAISSPQAYARQLLASLEGAMLIARLEQETASFAAVAESFLSQLQID